MAVAAAGSGRSVFADAIKANNELPLSDPASWVGNVLPNASTLAVFDHTIVDDIYPPLQNDATWLGISVRDVLGAWGSDRSRSPP